MKETMGSKVKEMNFKCSKCGDISCEAGQMRATSGFWTKLFNIQNLKFSTLICNNCGFTELYKKETKKAENILDFFTN
jgi:uncharacterized protein